MPQTLYTTEKLNVNVTQTYLYYSHTRGAWISIFGIRILSVSVIRIRTFLQIDIRIRYDSFSCIQSTGMNDRSKLNVKRLPVGGQLQDAHANLAQTCAADHSSSERVRYFTERVRNASSD